MDLKIFSNVYNLYYIVDRLIRIFNSKYIMLISLKFYLIFLLLETVSYFKHVYVNYLNSCNIMQMKLINVVKKCINLTRSLLILFGCEFEIYQISI
jgi:hypothetical protein